MESRGKSFIIFVCALAVGAVIGLRSWPTDPTLPRVWGELCQLVSQQIYLKQIHDWEGRCVRQGEMLPLISFSKTQFVSHMNRQFEELQVSHLSLVMPQEARRIWQNQAVDTGLRARRVEGEWYIFRIEPGSVAEELGFRKGDLIRGIGPYEVRFGSEIESTSGIYHLVRDGKYFDIELRARELQVVASPSVEMLARGVAYVQIPNFLPQYFEKEQWQKTVGKFRGASQIVIDLRDNYGGNFVAMLRALSPFFCDSSIVGEVRKKKDQGDQTVFNDNLEMESQLPIFDTHSVVVLKTFENYGCLRQPVTLLINENTQSVAEIFAQAMKARPHSRVLGTPSAGRVVLSVWYPVPDLGPGFSLSIPEAEYRDTHHEILEGGGVKPDQILSYRQSEIKKGVDNWVTDALEFSK